MTDLLKEWKEAADAFLLCKPGEEEEAKRRYLDVDKRCREVFGAVIPKSI